MATGTAGSVALQYESSQVHYLYKDIVFGLTSGTESDLGWVPADASILTAGALVSEAFNSGTSDVLDIGTDADPNGMATALDLTTIGLIVWDELATSNDLGPYSAATKLTYTCTKTGSAATTGIVRVFVTYMVGNQG